MELREVKAKIEVESKNTRQKRPKKAGGGGGD